MDNVLNKLTDQIKKELPGELEARKNALEETNKKEGDYLSYLNDRGDIVKILKLIRDKKLSNRTIRIKIKEFLKDPGDINDFLLSVKNNTKKYKKEETKEISTSSAAGMSYSTKLFSEPQKVETKEATSTASSGQYSTPKVWAKSTSKKDWRGKSKTQIPGGKLVQVKKKCKRFPYCNQGDIKALNIFENEVLNNVIKTVSEKYGIDVDTIKTIIISEWNKRNN
jgi:hypothetical protein